MMKKFLLLLFCVASICNFLFSQNKQWTTPIKSGYIEYKLTGSTLGNRYMWWTDYGRIIRVEEKSVTVVKIMGIKNEEKNNRVTVMKNGEFWNADLNNNTGQRGKFSDFQDLIKFYEGMTKEEIKKLEEEVLSAFGGEKVGRGVVLGKDCDIIEVMGSKIWIYRGMSLKSEVDIMGIRSKEEAVVFKTNIVIPGKKFMPISGVEYKDISEEMQKGLEELSKADFRDYEEDKGDVDENDEIPEDIEKVGYSYSRFKEVMKNFSYNKYRRLMVVSNNGQYVATFMKGFGKTLLITAASDSYVEKAYVGEYEKFKHKGLPCLYGDEAGSGSILIVKYNKLNMNIIVTTNNKFEKSEMLNIIDKLSF